MTIAIVDTSVFLNALGVPGRDQNRDDVRADFGRRIDDGHSLILPIAAIIETGNHIAQLGNGQRRRQFAELFVQQVRMMLNGRAPWVVARAIDAEDLALWIEDFPDHAMRRRGIADVSIIGEYERQCALNTARTVEIWSLDGHLAGYRREPRLRSG